MNDKCRELRVQRVNDHLTPEGPEVDSQSAPPLPHLRPPVNTGVSPVIYCCFFNIPGSENAAAVQSLESGALFSSAVNRELHHNLCAPGFRAGRYGLKIMMMCDTCRLHHDTRHVRDARCGFLQPDTDNLMFLYEFLSCSLCNTEGKKAEMQWANMDDLIRCIVLNS